MGDFRKKISCRLNSREKNSSKEIPGYLPTLEKKYLSWLVMLKKKILHRCMSGKKILSLEIWEK